MVGATAGFSSTFFTISVTTGVAACLASISAARVARSASKGLFSLSSAALKSSFLTGDSILRDSMAEVACRNALC